jgi:hypothetical protein
LRADSAEFQCNFGRRAFSLEHDLAENSLFSLEALEDAADSWAKLGKLNLLSVSVGQTRTDARFSEIAEKSSISGAIRDLSHSGSYVKISDINALNTNYEEVLQQALRDVEDLLGQRVVPRITWAQMTVFLASPNIVLPTTLTTKRTSFVKSRERRTSGSMTQTIESFFQIARSRGSILAI